MKNITIVATLLFALILSSCSTLKNTDIAKRRYNKGYYIAVRDQKTKTEPVATQTVNKKTDKVVSTAAPEETVTATPAQTAVVQPVSETAKTNVTSAAKSKTQEPAVAVTTEKKQSVKKHSGLRNPVIKQKTWSANNQSAESDLKLILLVILAIIIPPLAVYLVEKTSTMFWITLILWLIGGGLGFGVRVYFSIAWIVAIVLALLVVLR